MANYKIMLNGMHEPADFEADKAVEKDGCLLLLDSRDKVIGRFHLDDVRCWGAERQLDR